MTPTDLSGRGTRVLIIEDHPATAGILRRLGSCHGAAQKPSHCARPSDRAHGLRLCRSQETKRRGRIRMSSSQAGEPPGCFSKSWRPGRDVSEPGTSGGRVRHARSRRGAASCRGGAPPAPTDHSPPINLHCGTAFLKRRPTAPFRHVRSHGQRACRPERLLRERVQPAPAVPCKARGAVWISPDLFCRV